MEENKTAATGRAEEKSGGFDKATVFFRQWESEGLDPAAMFARLSEIFDRDPQGAEEMFGGEYLDIVDYFTHYWC